MSGVAALVQQICEQAQALPEDYLLELAQYIEFLQFRAQEARPLQERLVSDYDELANHYDELAAELADETWLPLENEALISFHRHSVCHRVWIVQGFGDPRLSCPNSGQSAPHSPDGAPGASDDGPGG